MLVAVEPSGDEIGAAFLAALKSLAPEAEFLGCGGPLMAAVGFQSLFEIDALSVMGFLDVIRAFPEATKRADALADAAAAEAVDAVVFIDGWYFSRAAAARMKKRGVKAKRFKLVAPQIWASRPQRVHFVRKHFDGVLCLLPFEPPLFEKAGVKAAFIGNPNFQHAWRMRGDGARFRARHQLGDAPLLAVLPGSRRSEATILLPIFSEAARLVADRLPALRIVVAPAPQIEALVAPVVKTWPGAPIIAAPEEKADAFAAADAALAKSGTVTTELAIASTPMAVAYKFDPLTAFWLKRVVTTRYASILNIAAGSEVIPEFIQRGCRADYLAGAALKLLTDKEARLDQLEAFPPLLAYLGVDGPPAARRAAEIILAWMDGSQAAGNRQ